MLKMKYKGMIVLGLIPSELEHLKQSQPLNIKLDDLGLQGHKIIILCGETNEKLRILANEVADKLEAGPDRRIVLQ